MPFIKNARSSGKYLSEILDIMVSLVREGSNGDLLNKKMNEYCKLHDIIPGFLGFNGFPKSICLCVNDEIVHGIPNDKPFRNGDLVTIDAGIIYKGACTDAARSVIVGGKSSTDIHLLNDGTRLALEKGISVVGPGVCVGEISVAVEKSIKESGLYILDEFCGHGLGETLHEDPIIPNETHKYYSKVLLKPWQMIAIEPIISATKAHAMLDDDNWCYRTNNGSYSCQWEDTVLVTDSGFEILTRT